MQFENLNVLEHGIMVKTNFDNFFTMNTLPESLTKELADKLFSLITTDEEHVSFYQIYHDLGKPYCLEIDDEGKKHYPNHAAVSKEIYSNIIDIEMNEDVAWFIEHDMDFHKMKMDEWDDYVKDKTLNQLSVLYLTFISEVNANREMFGETNFKIKLKKANQITKKIQNTLNKNQNA